ncbi:hypothetical protein OK349_11700 [Sphingomonas sp. BT-65]|nr:type IV conjugative transfer system pilin TraA [Sphingomonas sp. BT-65]MCW4462372.1 hypothetical protein [Sphingomonas sp. BT-65]
MRGAIPTTPISCAGTSPRSRRSAHPSPRSHAEHGQPGIAHDRPPTPRHAVQPRVGKASAQSACFERRQVMRISHAVIPAALVAAALAPAALAQSSNTSSNSSSNNGVVRERIVDSYCDRGGCERSVVRRTYRDDGRDRRWRAAREGRYESRRWRDDDDDD